MANFSTWSKGVPSGASLQREFDDLYRSDKSILEATLNAEHYYESSSASSAGVHRLGSARIYMGTRSQVSSPSDGYGRLMYASDTSSLHILGPSSTTTIASADLHDSRYVKIAGSTMTGALVVGERITSSETVTAIGGGGVLHLPANGTNGQYIMIGRVGSSSASTSFVQTGDSTDFGGVLHLQPEGGSLLAGTGAYTIWHSGNDGAGSGLDADTVDGINFSSVTSSIAALGIAANGNNGLNFAFSGVTYGDAIVIGYRGDSGLVLQPRVSSPDTVNVTIHNLFGSTQTLDAQVIRLTRISG